MNLQNLLLKNDHMYAAIGSAIEPDLTKFPPTLELTERWVTVRHDFNQGLDHAQIKKAFQLVRSIANLIRRTTD